MKVGSIVRFEGLLGIVRTFNNNIPSVNVYFEDGSTRIIYKGFLEEVGDIDDWTSESY